MDKESFGHRIRRIRTEKNLSVRELAETIGVSIKTIYGWENNRNLPDFSHYSLLRSALSVSMDELFGFAKDTLVLSDVEKKLIMAYRQLPEMQKSVNRLLGLDEGK